MTVDLLTPRRQTHTCPSCTGSFQSPASHTAKATVGPSLAPSPYAALRSLIVYRGDLYDGRAT